MDLICHDMGALIGGLKDHFDYFYREYDEFVFPMTIHPDVSGRPHVLLMHER